MRFNGWRLVGCVAAFASVVSLAWAADAPPPAIDKPAPSASPSAPAPAPAKLAASEAAAPAPAPTSPLDQAALEKALAERLSGSIMAGSFSVTGKPGLREDKYTIAKVTKLQGELWMFLVRIQYGNRDVNVPLPVPIKWAGDTAVISVTNLTVPGMGTYSARVLIHGDQYAGVWSASDHGGQMIGTIRKDPKAQAGEKPEGKPAETKPVDTKPGGTTEPRP